MNKEQASKILTNYNQPVYGFTSNDIKEAIDYVRSIDLSKSEEWLLGSAIKSEQWLDSKFKNTNFNRLFNDN